MPETDAFLEWQRYTRDEEAHARQHEAAERWMEQNEMWGTAEPLIDEAPESHEEFEARERLEEARRRDAAAIRWEREHQDSLRRIAAAQEKAANATKS